MTAFVKEGTREEVGVITDFVDPQYVPLIAYYTHSPTLSFLVSSSLSSSSLTPTWTSRGSRHSAVMHAVTSTCSGIFTYIYVILNCSLSASWTKNGYPSSFSIG